MLTSGRCSAGRLISRRLYGLGSVCGGSHVAQVVHANPVTRTRARKRRRFMVVALFFLRDLKRSNTILALPSSFRTDLSSYSFCRFWHGSHHSQTDSPPSYVTEGYSATPKFSPVSQHDVCRTRNKRSAHLVIVDQYCPQKHPSRIDPSTEKAWSP